MESNSRRRSKHASICLTKGRYFRATPLRKGEIELEISSYAHKQQGSAEQKVKGDRHMSKSRFDTFAHPLHFLLGDALRLALAILTMVSLALWLMHLVQEGTWTPN